MCPADDAGTRLVCVRAVLRRALRSLAVTLGLPESIAWLWPCASDVAIAQATLCLLSLSRRGGAMQLRGASVVGDVVAEKRRPRAYEARPAAARRNDSPAVAATAADEGALSDSLDTAAIQHGESVAESLVRDGVPRRSIRGWWRRSWRSARPGCRRAPLDAPTRCTTPPWAGS